MEQVFPRIRHDKTAQSNSKCGNTISYRLDSKPQDVRGRGIHVKEIREISLENEESQKQAEEEENAKEAIEREAMRKRWRALKTKNETGATQPSSSESVESLVTSYKL